MQLKKIILKGFKSFSDKTVLEFNEGVTAIVGPNGSGKSNIIEAIRWVMGEQSAKTLRGDRMNDIIFSGTNERKPLNIAEVELILDNSDHYLDIEFEEVSILRRISRSGDSTYMINQQECRLRDIVDLFMDSGLGKESFSIISQGKVEAIFNSKPEERRGIFEEAAGVYKYKVRKKDAEKKLGQTQENLDRVQDILYELESQLEPLKRQSDLARSYLEQKEKLTDLDVGVTVWQIQNLRQLIDEDTTNRLTLVRDLEEIETQLQLLEESQTNQREILTDLENLREQVNEELVEIVRKKERTEAALNLFDEKAKHREVFIGEKQMSIQQVTAQLETYQAELVEVEATYQEKNTECSRLDNEIVKLQEHFNVLEGDKELQMEELRSHYIELLQQETSLKNEKNYLQQEMERSQKDETKTSSHVETLEKIVEEQTASLKILEENYELVNQELTQLLNDYKEIEVELNEKKQSLATQNERINRTMNELERAKAKQSSLQDMQENYAGYYTGVRAVMQHKDSLEGVVGTVAELIQIPEQFVQAIDTVLGSSSQFVVVQDEKAARASIQYLKQNRKGRATFLPLTTIKPRYLSEANLNKAAAVNGFIGIASELVSNDKSVQTIIDNLLGQTIVAETLESANAIARAIQFRNRVVSLEGDVMNAGGSMTGGGGRQNNTSPIFTQKSELDALGKFIKENQQVMEKLLENRDETDNHVTQLGEKIEDIRAAGEEKRLEEQQLQNKVSNVTDELHRFERELKASSFEMNESKHLNETYQQKFAEIVTALEKTSNKVKASNERMQLLSSEQENIDEEKAKISSQISSINAEYHSVREELATIRTSRQHLEQQIAQEEKQIDRLNEDIRSFDNDVESDSKEDLEEILQVATNKEDELKNQQVEIRQLLVEENEKFKELTDLVTKHSGRNKYLAEEKSKIDIRLSRNDVRMDHYLDYLVDEYKVGYEEARLLDQPDLPLEEAQKQVKLLKKGIEELGPVNLNSIEEYQHIDERYTFLSVQQNDLIEAKANLFNTMDEMDAIVEKRFKETFDKIQKEFAIVFPKMFGGGYAELVLNEPDNLLETGIEIIAQPPGKRLTRLSLLSGGERALTAISLLFAIIQVNPIPFCILDEAEAALDDANVVRFGQYLENFEAETQFIVITHRKGTMEHSNRLYGVTMQEKGVSKIVAVSLSEAEQMDGVS